jgi:hypothetical protein
MSYLGRSAKLSLKAQEKVSFLATAGQTVKTGLSYVPSFVEVYVNGVLLTDTTDFTATNGNSITFTVALLLNDEVTVISLKTFTVADHYNKTEADTLLATKAPIASPVFTGNVGVGVTPSSWASPAKGLQVGSTASLGEWNNGSSIVSLLGSNSYFNSGYKYSTTNTAAMIRLINGAIDIRVAPSGSADSAITFTTGLEVLADGKARAKNGLLFGTDTAAANALDDYEEGTWTPAFGRNGGTQPTVTYGEQVGSYTKVGNMVFLTGDMYISAISIPDNGNLTITGMPFTKGSGHNPTGSFTFTGFNFSKARSQIVWLDGTKLGFLGQTASTGAGSWNWEEVAALGGGEALRFAITYQV